MEAFAVSVKTIFSFFSGILVCGLLVFGIQSAMPIKAQTENVTSDNFSLEELLPDLEKIYSDALLTPLNEVKAKIYDDDIAQYYDVLLKRSALDMPQDSGN